MFLALEFPRAESSAFANSDVAAFLSLQSYADR
jgi:hypothetical protein